MTRDLDIVLEVGITNVHLLISLFEPDYYISQEEVELALHTFGMFNLIHQASVTKIDWIIKKPDAYSQSAFSRRKPIKIDGCQVSIISKEDLIVAKYNLAERDRLRATKGRYSKSASNQARRNTFANSY